MLCSVCFKEDGERDNGWLHVCDSCEMEAKRKHQELIEKSMEKPKVVCCENCCHVGWEDGEACKECIGYDKFERR